MYDNNYADKWENPAYVAAVKANIRSNANKTFLKSYERAEEISDYLEKIDYQLQQSDKQPISFLEKLSASLREYGKLSPKQYEAVCKVIDAAQDKRDALKSAIQNQKNYAESLGIKSEKFESTVTVKKIVTVKVAQFSRYDSDEAQIYIFNDQDNNTLVWKTKNILSNTANEFAWNLENSNAVKEGDVIVIKASIKAYTEYKGEKQTIIQRVKILEVI